MITMSLFAMTTTSKRFVSPPSMVMVKNTFILFQAVMIKRSMTFCSPNLAGRTHTLKRIFTTLRSITAVVMLMNGFVVRRSPTRHPNSLRMKKITVKDLLNGTSMISIDHLKLKALIKLKILKLELIIRMLCAAFLLVMGPMIGL